MGLRRVFYGHEGVVYPTGLVSPDADSPAGDEVVEYVTDDPNGEPVEIVGEPVEDNAEGPAATATLTDGTVVTDLSEAEIPDGSWKVPAINDWAKDHGIDLGDAKTKPEKLAVIGEALTKE